MIRLTVILLVGLVLSGCTNQAQQTRTDASVDERVKTLVELGTGYLRNGEYPRAKEHLNRALRIDPRSAVAHNAMALVFQLEQDYEIAEEHFKKAIRYDPASTRVRNNYGAFLFDRGRYQDAIKELKIAAEDRYYEQRPTVFENLGVSYRWIQSDAEAEAAFERAIALNPDQPRSLLELADMRYDQGQYIESRQLYRRYQNVATQTAQGMLLCIKLARVFENTNDEASCALSLRNLFPASREYQEYQELMAR